jgi:hypothetical protein
VKPFGTIMLQLPEELGEAQIMHFSIVKAESARVTVPAIKQPPAVASAIREVLRALTRLDNAQFTRAEQSAIFALTRAARQLRFAVNSDKPIPKKG